MTVERTQEQNEALLFSVVPMINKLAGESYTKFKCEEAKHPYEDVQSQAMLIAWNAVLSWDPEKAKITTHVYTQVWGRLQHYHRTRVRLNGGQNYMKNIHADLSNPATGDETSCEGAVGLVDRYNVKPRNTDATGDVDLMDDLSPLEKRLLSWIQSTPSVVNFRGVKRETKRVARDLRISEEEAVDVIEQLKTKLGA